MEDDPSAKEEDAQAKRKSSTRESARKLRQNSRRFITANIATIMDSWSLKTAGAAMKTRTRSCERDDKAEASAAASAASAEAKPHHAGKGVTPSLSSASFESATSTIARPGSLATPEGHTTTTYPTGRRFSEQQMSTSVMLSHQQSVENCCAAQTSAEDSEEKYLKRAQLKLQELLATERTYVEESLKEVVEGYLAYMENPENQVKIPADLIGGKDRMIFGNIRDIYEFHKKCIYPEMQKAVENPRLLKNLFESKGNSFKKKYGKFCLNKPKSEFIISQHNDKYFAVLRLKQGFKQALSTQLMTAVQRATRYPLLLREIEKDLKMAGDPVVHADVKRAYEIAQEIAEYANNMMSAGRMKGFNEDVNAQGLLLKRGDAICYKRKIAPKKPKMKQCSFFVFEESIIICENPQLPSERGFPRHLEFLASFKMNNVIVREFVKDGNLFGFELERQENRGNMSLKRDSSAKEYPVVVFHCQSEEQRDDWLKTINDQIRALKFLVIQLENPQHAQNSF